MSCSSDIFIFFKTPVIRQKIKKASTQSSTVDVVDGVCKYIGMRRSCCTSEVWSIIEGTMLSNGLWCGAVTSACTDLLEKRNKTICRGEWVKVFAHHEEFPGSNPSRNWPDLRDLPWRDAPLAELRAPWRVASAAVDYKPGAWGRSKNN